MLLRGFAAVLALLGCNVIAAPIDDIRLRSVPEMIIHRDGMDLGSKDRRGTPKQIMQNGGLDLGSKDRRDGPPFIVHNGGVDVGSKDRRGASEMMKLHDDLNME